MYRIPNIRNSSIRFVKSLAPAVLSKQSKHLSPKFASGGEGKLVRGLDELGRLSIDAAQSSLWIGFGTG
jgi:hypothetical protein